MASEAARGLGGAHVGRGFLRGSGSARRSVPPGSRWQRRERAPMERGLGTDRRRSESTAMHVRSGFARQPDGGRGRGALLYS
jgi:hypothetical protein